MTDETSPLGKLAANTRDVYERNAARYAAERAKVLVERRWLDRFLDLIPKGGHVLDAGCGPGDPVAAYIAGKGYAVTGIDFSAPMLEIARSRHPDGDWRHGDMRTLDLAERFDGIVGWDSFFHLTPGEQRTAIARFAAHLKPGGALMLTVGPEAGEVSGHVGDDTVYHASLSNAQYRDVLAGHGLEIVALVNEDPECDFHSVLLARNGERAA